MSRYCFNCGENAEHRIVRPVDEALRSTWEISQNMADLFNVREGTICKTCGANVRAQGLAKAILKSKYGFKALSLKDWVQEANKRGLTVCELNSCHKLHDTLSGLSSLTYSEYGTESQQDIENLTYPDDQFDLVLHSEVLEHVNDPQKAMDECRRVVKPDGLILFTTPVVWNRKTRRRTNFVDGQIRHVLPKSYHGQKTDDYLVRSEFGSDLGSLLLAGLALNDWKTHNYIFKSSKSGDKLNLLQRLVLSLQERRSEDKGA